MDMLFPPVDGHDSEPAVAMYKTKVNALVTTHDPRRGLLVISRLRDTSIGQQPSVANGRGAHAVRRPCPFRFFCSIRVSGKYL